MAKRAKNRKRAAAAERAPDAFARLPASLSWMLLAQVSVIVLAALGIYGCALSGDWLWDDDLLITDNYRMRSLHGLWEIWFASPTRDCWPLTSTLLWIEWRLWGMAPFGYHAVSLALHVTSAFLIWHLLRRLGLRWAWLAALLFVVHPLMVESVAWVAEIKNTFSLPFFLLACEAWLDAEEGKPLAYPRSILLYLAAMLAKTSTVMLPAVLLLYCWWKRQTLTRRELVRMVPYAVIAAGLGAITVYVQDPAFSQSAEIHIAPVDLGTPGERLLRAGAAIFFYLGKFLLPVGLLPIYARSALDAPAGLEALAFPCLALLLAGLWLRRKSWGRHALFGLGFFLITILPVIGLARMKYFEIAWVADHLVYLPIIGLIALLVAGLESLAGRINLSLRPYGAIALAILALGLAGMSRAYVPRFASQKALWTYTVQGNPDGYIPRNKLAYTLLEDHRYNEAIQQYEIALRGKPDDAEAYCNIGICLMQTGQLDRAQACLEKAVQLDPAFANARANLGGVFLQKGRFAEAADEFQQVLRSNPENPSMRFELGATLLHLGRAREAVDQFEQVLQLNPDFPKIHAYLARAQAMAAPAKP